jgi:hypothetical protein
MIGHDRISDPQAFLPKATMKANEYGGIDYYMNGKIVGYSSKNSNGSYDLYHMGRIKYRDTYYKNSESIVVRNLYNSGSKSSVNTNVFNQSNIEPKEVIRSGIDKTSYNAEGKPYYRWNSEEKSTSYIKDPHVRSEVREAQNKEWTRQRQNR